MQANRKPTISETTPWQELWRDGFRTPQDLLDHLELAQLAEDLPAADQTPFPFRVPHGFAARMRVGDADDPLLRQVLPQRAELLQVPGFSADAVGDSASRRAHGVLHKYQGRALLLATGSCAIHCRYCFRQHFPYQDEIAAANHWREALGYLRADTSITELLLSGGDPLSLATPKLAELTTSLRELPHIRRLRIHSRLPIVLPERIDAELVDWFKQLHLPCVLVLHANHANEIDASVVKACALLRDAGVVLLNQSVLLQGVNDEVEALAALSEALIDCGVMPYYLHQLDRVDGTAHFEVADERALRIVAELHARLPGYLVPRLVREVAGAAFKVPLFQL
jgi:EF-P beta-lysylation protein EpmB